MASVGVVDEAGYGMSNLSLNTGGATEGGFMNANLRDPTKGREARRMTSASSAVNCLKKPIRCDHAACII